MNAGHYRKLFTFNSWANRAFLDALEKVPSPQYHADMKSSHRGLHGTMVHIVFAQQVWLLHWTGREVDAAFTDSRGAGTLGEVRRYWETVEGETMTFLDSRLSEALPGESFTIRRSKGDAYSYTYGDSMQHFINHSSYHRGQVAAMMRQIGIVPPTTDFIRFVRERQ